MYLANQLKSVKNSKNHNSLKNMENILISFTFDFWKIFNNDG